MAPSYQPIAGIAPQAPAVSLLTSARRLPAGTVWQSGVTWQSIACAKGHGWPICQTDVNAVKENPTTFDLPKFQPYLLYVPFACDWATPQLESEFRDDAKLQLDAVTAFLVSREVWTAEIETTNPSLISTAEDVSETDELHPVAALGLLLEKWEACAQGGRPVVHAPTRVVNTLLAHGVVKQQGDVYYGPGGSIVSPGPGYPSGAAAGAPDDGAAGDEDAWVYISGPVEYELGPIEVTPDNTAAHLDRRTNKYRVEAQRLAIHRFDPCCVKAARVFIPRPAKTEGSP